MRPRRASRRGRAMAVTTEEVLGSFHGDESFPIDWAAGERELFWIYDDLHIPNPVSPLFFDIGGWWLTCDHMFRRFGTPFACDWIAKVVNGYVYTAAVPCDPSLHAEATEYENRYVPRVPRDPAYAGQIGAYLGGVLPVYAANFMNWWKTRLRPEIERNFAYLDGFDTESASLLELAVLLEDAMDIHDRLWKIHWMLNFAQFASTMNLNAVIEEVAAGDVMTALQGTERGRRFVAERIETHQKTFGYKAMWSHELMYKLWVEDPAPIIEAIRGYVATDYDYPSNLAAAEDVVFLRYNGLRRLMAAPGAFDAKDLVSDRRDEHEEAYERRAPAWLGTATKEAIEFPYGGLWGFPDRFYAGEPATTGEIKGLAASPGVVEGPARFVASLEEFDQVHQGEILVCRMTNQAWVVLFTKIKGLVTEAGGTVSHPAVVAREFGIPAVVGTGNAGERIKTGDVVRVNGATGVVEILG